MPNTETRAEAEHPRPHEYLREMAVAELLGVTRRTLEDWRRLGTGPPWVRMTRRSVRYRRADVDAWAEKRLARSTQDPFPSQPGA